VLEHAARFAVSLVTTPFLAAIVMLVYFDLRVRKEGFDLALLAERMGGGPAGGPAPEPAGAFAGAGWFGAGGGRDAFGHPATPAGPSTRRPAAEPSPPGGWAPPVAPVPRRPSRPPAE
jgi:hypothetical protein